jgi:hypothetical protein
VTSGGRWWAFTFFVGSAGQDSTGSPKKVPAALGATFEAFAQAEPAAQR